MAKIVNNVSNDIKRFEKAINKALKEVAIVGLVELQLNAKVDTGNLRRSHAYKLDKNLKRVTWGVTKTAKYGVYVEFKPYAKGGRPWFRKTLNANVKTFQDITLRNTKGV